MVWVRKAMILTHRYLGIALCVPIVMWFVYYYARGQDAPLPVLRVKFDDPDRTWFYIDPGTSRILDRLTWRARLNRWVFFGLHTFDFSFWYYNRPLWDIGVIALSIGGGVSSAIGLLIGFRRLKRNARRITRPAIRT